MRVRTTALLASFMLLIGLFPAQARVDEAHSMIMEAVQEYIVDGFTLRADYWNGNLETGKQKLVRHQLFLGNDYWFWLGTSYEGCKLQIEVYDADGMKVSVERTDSKYVSGVRVTPKKTGSYYILIKILWEEENKKADEVDWALVYGYR